MSSSHFNAGLSFFRVFLAIAVVSAGEAVTHGAKPHNYAAGHVNHQAAKVDPGDPEVAIDYYEDVVQPAIGVTLIKDRRPAAFLDDLLVFVGYRTGPNGITADRVERFDSSVLMDAAQLKSAIQGDGGDPAAVPNFAKGNVLASRWFSPKITDVAQFSHPPEYHRYGWRKLVRLVPLAGSLAERKSIDSVYLLFNIFANTKQMTGASPFAQRSGNNQMILVRRNNTPGFADDPMFWLVFDGFAKGGGLILALNASFDYRDPSTVPPGSAYYVPDACAQCHGGSRAQGKLNFLDTDHWFDRVLPGDDFEFIASTSHGVLFDGGKDESSQQFSHAFEVIRTINRMVEAQVQDVDPSGTSLGFRSVFRWNFLHASSVPVHRKVLDDMDGDGILDRAIVGDTSALFPNDMWRKNDRVDEALFPLLNRYCYRCHSSVIYSVYDRSAVRLRSQTSPGQMGLLQRYVTVPDPIVPFMPQDRTLPSDVRDRIVNLVDRLTDGEKKMVSENYWTKGLTTQVVNINGNGSTATYQPTPINIEIGQSIRWKNNSNVTHTATSDQSVGGMRLFDTGSIASGGQKDVVFDANLFQKSGGVAGGTVTIDYHCTPHPKMKAKIILTDAPHKLSPP